MTDKEIERVRRQVDAIANPLTILALMWLLANPDRERPGVEKPWTDGGRAWGGPRKKAWSR